MDPRRWAKIESLYNQALEIPANERSGFLVALCADGDVLPEVQSLLHYADLSFTAPLQSLADRLQTGFQWAPGDRVLQYEVLSSLGQGSMGKVYRARDLD